MGAAIERSGGSAANTIAGLASFGARSAFIGLVADDKFGHFSPMTSAPLASPTTRRRRRRRADRALHHLRHARRRAHHEHLPRRQRELHAADLEPSLIEQALHRLSRGLSVRSHRGQGRLQGGCAACPQVGAKVALTLSDAFCVDRHRADFRELIREGTDIVFANEKETTSFYQEDSFAEAADAALADCELAVLTRSEQGSVIVAMARPSSLRPSPSARWSMSLALETFTLPASFTVHPRTAA